MRKLFFLPVLFILLLLQVTVLDFIKVFSVKPDMIVVSIIIASVFFELKFALFCSLIAGLFKDVFAANPYGFYTLFMPVWCFVISFVSRKLTIEDKLVLSGVAFVIVFLNSFFFRFLNALSMEKIAVGIYLRIALLESVYSAMFLPLLLRIFNKLRLFETNKIKKEFYAE